MSSVEALLRVPTDEVQTCPPVSSDEDISLIVVEIETILKKSLYALRYSLAESFTAFLHLLLQAATLQCVRVSRALMTPAEEGRCTDLLGNVCGTLLRPESYSFRRVVNMESFFEFLRLVCSTDFLKDCLAEVLMQHLLNFLYESVETEDDFRQPRACTSVLITLLRGSKANKNRMSVECGHIGELLARSEDIFFQMQCVEILFRLYTHNRTVLATSRLPDFLMKGISELPNDATLLTSIQNLLDAYNADNNSSRLAQFSVLRIEVDDTEVCGYTSMYFSPLILVVMLPGGTGDNITIPYEHIRSVKLSKYRKLGVRLHIIPTKLSYIMGLGEGKDTLMASVTQSTLSAIRSSRIHEWIAERKCRVPVSSIRHPPEVPKLAPASVSMSRKESIQNASGKCHNAAPIAPSEQLDAPMPLSPEESENMIQPRRKSSAQPSPQKNDIAFSSTENDKGLDQLHSAASQKVLRIRQDRQGELQLAVDFMQEEFEKMRRVNARERDEFESSVREDLTEIRRAEAILKDRAAGCVQELNKELSEVQDLGERLKVEIDKLRERLSATLKKSQSIEEESLVKLKTMVDGEMKSMEGALLQLMSSTNPLSFLTTYLSRKVNGASS